MRIVKGNKTENIFKEDFLKLVAPFERVIFDIGTGDGRFVYKNALENPGNFYVGVDPVEKQLQIYSKEANKKRLNNVLFVNASVELLPEELKGAANEIYINLPWGSLLESIVKPTEDFVKKMADLGRPACSLLITFGYAFETDPSETKRMALPELNEHYVKGTIAKSFERENIWKLRHFSEVKKEELASMETTWGKRLTFGEERQMFRLGFSRCYY